MDIGKKLKQLRESNNVSVYKLAKDIGVSASYIYELEKGKKSKLSLDKLQLICNFFGLSLKEFFTDDDQEPPGLTQRRIIKAAHLLNDTEAETIWNIIELILKKKGINYLEDDS